MNIITLNYWKFQFWQFYIVYYYLLYKKHSSKKHSLSNIYKNTPNTTYYKVYIVCWTGITELVGKWITRESDKIKMSTFICSTAARPSPHKTRVSKSRLTEFWNKTASHIRLHSIFSNWVSSGHREVMNHSLADRLSSRKNRLVLKTIRQRSVWLY